MVDSDIPDPRLPRLNRLIGGGDWLDGVRRVSSPNCDDRPPDTAVDLLVVHCISLPPGEFGTRYVEQLFLNQLDPRVHPYFATIADLRVSAHVLIARSGELTQFVPFSRRAWHAGASSHEGRSRCNDFSIGVELEGTETVAYTDAQYERLSTLTRLLLRRWPGITPQRIVGHCDIAPERKTDPGPVFDWQRFRSALT